MTEPTASTEAPNWVPLSALRTTYTERSNLVALLAQLYPSYWDYSDPECPDWPVVYIDLPTGQASWHIHPDDWWIFANAQRRHDAQWDGHSTDEKYQRVRNLILAIETGEQSRAGAAIPSEIVEIEGSVGSPIYCLSCLLEAHTGQRTEPNPAWTIVNGAAHCREHLKFQDNPALPGRTPGRLILGQNGS